MTEVKLCYCVRRSGGVSLKTHTEFIPGEIASLGSCSDASWDTFLLSFFVVVAENSKSKLEIVACTILLAEPQQEVKGDVNHAVRDKSNYYD